MSMGMIIYTVADLDINDVVRQPIRLQILYNGEIYEPSVLEGLDDQEKEEIARWKPSHQSERYDVEGTFQAIHYLLTKEQEWGKGKFPLNFLTGQRLPIGEIGWGKANFYTSLDVRQIADALNTLDLDKIKKRYNADFYNKEKIYPGGYTWKTGDDEYLLEKIKNLAAFVNHVRDQGLGFYIVLV